MLDIVLFVLTSPPADQPISPLSNQVTSVAMSNIDGFTSTNLLQQMYGTQVVDEDVDLKLSDEELELIANTNLAKCDDDKDKVCSKDSDVIVGGNKIVSFGEIQQFVERPERHQELIDFIRRRFQESGIRVDREDVYGVIAENLRATAPINTKRAHRGFKIALTGPYASVLCYLDTPCQF